MNALAMCLLGKHKPYTEKKKQRRTSESEREREGASKKEELNVISVNNKDDELQTKPKHTSKTANRKI